MIKRINTIIVIAIVVSLVQCMWTENTSTYALLMFAIFPAVAMCLQWGVECLFGLSRDAEKRINRIESATAMLDQAVHKELFALAAEVAGLKGREDED